MAACITACNTLLVGLFIATTQGTVEVIVTEVRTIWASGSIIAMQRTDIVCVLCRVYLMSYPQKLSSSLFKVIIIIALVV